MFALQRAWTGADATARDLPVLPVVLFIVLAHGVLFVWQVVGVVRAGERHVLERGSTAAALGAQLGAAALFWLTLVHALAAWQTTLASEESALERGARERDATYAIEPLDGGGELRLRGPIALGATARLRDALERHPGADTIVLESDGGNVYAARGLARLFRERGLSTHVESSCASACAIAFIGGVRRTLGPDARLGLHRYRIDAAHTVIVTDPASEQRRDRALYTEAGVAPWFVERMFDAGAGSMWWPPPRTLLRAGVAHVIDVPTAPAALEPVPDIH